MFAAFAASTRRARGGPLPKVCPALPVQTDPTAAFEYPSQPPTSRVSRRPFESAQYLSIKCTERLAEAGIEPSVGSVGNSYDCETIGAVWMV
jgi:hypothetical protein